MPVVKKDKKGGKDGICDDEKEAVIEKVLKIERKSVESGLIFLNEIKGSHVCNEGSEEHIDHEDKNHFGHDFIAKFGIGVVIGILLRTANYSAEERAEKWNDDWVYEGKDDVSVLDGFALLYQLLCQSYDQKI